MSISKRTPRRPGFTLPELLVVIGIMTTLSALVAVYVVPAFRDNKNVIRGLDRLTTTLLIAKQRALRDQAPRGVRLLADANDIVRELQYIEQPEVYASGRITNIQPTTGTNPRMLTFTQVDFIGGATTGDIANYVVAPGDYFRRKAGGTWAVRILRVADSKRLLLPDYTPDMTSIPGPGEWEIIRRPRPIAGEEPIALPENVVIDLALVRQYGPNNQVQPTVFGANRYYDIVFDPAGGVMNTSSRTMVLWVRDFTSEDPVNDRQRSRLLSVNPRTGFLAAHEVGPAVNPLRFALDGRASGL